jgi:hypothetical protein
MPRVGLFNMTFGFFLLTFAAAAGSFVATDMTEAFLRDPAALNSWRLTLERSAHGHTNLFALLHIAFGLTLPYSRFSRRVKWLQTLGLGLGSLVMAVLMVVRAGAGPVEGYDPLQLMMGAGLSAALLALAAHAVALMLRMWERAPS